MNPTIRFHFDACYLEYDPLAATTLTHFHDASWTGGAIVADDEYHAERLKLTPQLHRLQHELAHHLVAIHYYQQPHSMILWQAAHPHEQLPSYTKEEEWLVTALQYHSQGVGGPTERNDRAALKLIGLKVDVNELATRLRRAIELCRSASEL